MVSSVQSTVQSDLRSKEPGLLVSGWRGERSSELEEVVTVTGTEAEVIRYHSTSVHSDTDLQLSVTQHTRLSMQPLQEEEAEKSSLTQLTTPPVRPRSGTGSPAQAPAAARAGARQPGRESWTAERQESPHFRHPPSVLISNSSAEVERRKGRRRHRDNILTALISPLRLNWLSVLSTQPTLSLYDSSAEQWSRTLETG